MRQKRKSNKRMNNALCSLGMYRLFFLLVKPKEIRCFVSSWEKCFWPKCDIRISAAPLFYRIIHLLGFSPVLTFPVTLRDGATISTPTGGTSRMFYKKNAVCGPILSFSFLTYFGTWEGQNNRRSYMAIIYVRRTVSHRSASHTKKAPLGSEICKDCMQTASEGAVFLKEGWRQSTADVNVNWLTKLSFFSRSPAVHKCDTRRRTWWYYS